MILHASSDAKKGKLITTPPQAPKNEKKTLNLHAQQGSDNSIFSPW